MDILVLGKIPTKELASWFKISYSTFRKKSNVLLKELEYYCDYEKYHGGVNIKEIHLEEYCKELVLQINEVYLSEVKQTNNFLSTVAGMARKLRLEYPDSWGKYSQSGLEKKLRKAGNILFGKTNLPIYRQDQIERYSGPCGYKEYYWAIKVDDLNKYRYLTEEEKHKFTILIDSYNISKEDIALKEQYNKQLLDDLQNDRMTKEEYILAMQDTELFPDLLSNFRRATGLTLVRATYHDIQNSAF